MEALGPCASRSPEGHFCQEQVGVNPHEICSAFNGTAWENWPNPNYVAPLPPTLEAHVMLARRVSEYRLHPKM